MTNSKKTETSPNNNETLINSSSTFKLESLYEDISLIFKSSQVKKASSKEVIIAVDTNILLLPYTIRKDGLSTLQQFYKKVRSEGRLFLPARVAREFIGNRDKKLSELLKTLSDTKSRINIGEPKLSPILEGLEGSEQLSAASKSLSEAKEKYTAAISLLEGKVRSWSGDDPVTSMYATVFDSDNIVSPTQDNDEIAREWEVRLREQIPPGYKDGGKADTGIGDFLIWKSLLNLGSAEKKDLIFVTGEEKADWFVRVNGGGAYPRPELVAEYRKHSGGKNIRLVGLHDVLREMEAPQDFVFEIELAEQTANTIFRAESLISEFARRRNTATAVSGNLNVADFRLGYGGENITFSSENASGLIETKESDLGFQFLRAYATIWHAHRYHV